MLQSLNNDHVTVAVYKYKKEIEGLKASVETLEDTLAEKEQLCSELATENEILANKIKGLNMQIGRLKKGEADSS